MLSERRLRILIKALFIEMLELWDRARVPQQRWPRAMVEAWQRRYFAQRLGEAIAALAEDNSELLSEVLAEILLIAIGEDAVEGWEPPVLCHGAELLRPL